MLAVVTGATGCIGRNLVDALLVNGWSVVALHRGRHLSRLAGLDIELRPCNLHNSRSVSLAMPNRPDAVFHVAANLSHYKADYQQQWRDNVLGTRNMVAAAIAKKARRFVLTSTGAVQSTVKSGYVTTKQQAEREVCGIDSLILRPPIVFGRFDWNNYSQLFRQRFLVAPPGDGTFCDARDVASAHIEERVGIHEIGGHRTTWLDLFQRIARLTGQRAPTRAVRLWVLMAAAYLTAWQQRPLLTPDLVRLFSCGPTKSSSGGQHSLDEMLADCWQWLAVDGGLPSPLPPPAARM